MSSLGKARVASSGAATGPERVPVTSGGPAPGDGGGWDRLASDRPIRTRRDDLLNYQTYADAIARLIDNPRTEGPLTLAINGPWGVGKSSVGRLVQEQLESKTASSGEHPHVTCWFDAWMHDDAEHLPSAFLAEVAQAANRHRAWWRRLLSPLPLGLRSPSERALWRGLLGASFAAAILLLAVAAAVAVPEAIAPPWIDALRDRVGGPIASVVLVAVGCALLAPPLSRMASAVSSFVRDPGGESGAGAMKKVRRQVGRLVAQATPRGSRFVIFVDDLERCRPPRAIDLLESANQLLNHPQVVVIVMADMNAVASCVAIKYSELARSEQRTDLRAFGRQYLQKIVQVEFNMPVPVRHDRPLEEAESARRHASTGLLQKAKALLRRLVVGRVIRTRAGLSAFARASLVSSWGLLWIGAGAAVPGRPLGQFIPEGSPFHAFAILSGFAAALGGGVMMAGYVLTNWFADRVEEAVAAEGPDRVRGFGGTGADARRIAAILEEKRALFLADHSDFARLVADEAMRHVEPLPRTMRRVRNKARLMALMSVDRGLTSMLDPRQLGKWIALEERWPDLVDLARREPDTFRSIEDVLLGGRLPEKGVLPVDWAREPDLRNLLLAEPRLGDDIRRLVLMA